MISERTRDAAMRKGQGMRLANCTDLVTAQVLDAARTTAEARRFAENVAPIIREIRASGGAEEPVARLPA